MQHTWNETHVTCNTHPMLHTWHGCSAPHLAWMLHTWHRCSMDAADLACNSNTPYWCNYMRWHTHTRTHTDTQTYTHRHTHIHHRDAMQLLELTRTHTHTLTHTLTRTCIYVYVCNKWCWHTHSHTHKHAHTHVCIYTLQNHLPCDTTIQQCVCHELMFGTHTPVSAAYMSVSWTHLRRTRTRVSYICNKGFHTHIIKGFIPM